MNTPATMSSLETDQVPAPSSEKLDRALVRGMAWTGAVKWIGQALSWMATIVVARLLAPSDYGLLAMATAFLSLVALINEFGLGSAIVYQERLESKQIAQLNTLALLLGFAGFVLASLAALPLAIFYRAPDLTWVVVALGLGFVVTGLTSVPNAVLEKGFRFKLLAVLEGGQAALVAVSTVALALLGFGYWALVWGRLLGLVVGAVVLLVFFRQRFAFPQWQDIRSIISVSWQLCFGRWCWFVASTSDVFIAGRILGQASLGAYSMGLTLASMPIDKISALVSRVTPALFSTVQSDRVGLTRYFLGFTAGLSLLSFPVGVGLALVSDDLVRLVLGDKWEAAIVPLQILGVYSGIRATSSPAAYAMFAIGEMRFGMWNAVFAMFLLPTAFYIGSSWGAAGIALAWALAHPVNSAVMFWRLFRGLALPTSVYFKTLWPAISATGVMVLCVLGARVWFAGEFPMLPRLVCEMTVGGISYVGTIWIFHREYVDHVRYLIRSARA